MNLAFVLFHYFPYGGLERDMLAMAQTCEARGHRVTIYTQSWSGPKPDGMAIVELPVRAITNHGRALAFVKRLQVSLHQRPAELVVGFNKMPGLDVYYAADVCFAQKVYEERGWLYRLSGRSRSYLAMEKAVFGLNSTTHSLIISPAQITAFKHYYATPDARLHRLPPGIKRDRVMPVDYAQQRPALREKFGLAESDYLLLMVGSDFRRKGVARSIRALPELLMRQGDGVQLWIAGLDAPQKFLDLARQLGVDNHVRFLGARDDVPQLMWAADIFVHPAHSEAAGAVLLEAAIAGLPVVATDVCGYAPFISEQHLGVVISSFEADARLAAAIIQVAAEDPALWRINGSRFSQEHDIYSMTDRAADLIESIADLSFTPTQVPCLGNHHQ